MTTYREIVERAEATVDARPDEPLASSARLCLDDARSLLGRGQERLAATRALHAVGYVVGVYAAEYQDLDYAIGEVDSTS